LDPQERYGSSLHVFTDHFLERTEQRSAFDSEEPIRAIAQFFLDGGFGFHNHWKAKPDDLYFLNNWGISLGNLDETTTIMRHNTFISREMLKRDQSEDVKRFFERAIQHTTKEENEYL